ncbi:MAG: TIGR02449 family protein [Pseudomonadota bacterium]
MTNQAEPKQVPGTEQLNQLESQVDELLVLTQVLSKENKALRAQQQNWSTERAKLIEKNELAKNRVESMITRLKALERE